MSDYYDATTATLWEHPQRDELRVYLNHPDLRAARVKLWIGGPGNGLAYRIHCKVEYLTNKEQYTEYAYRWLTHEFGEQDATVDFDTIVARVRGSAIPAGTAGRGA